ncbi:hypothetical protein INH39_21785 [Massilia violaceinigra]|uniref:Uncharacterized protein n=1 Tax=Massilia violaceinigra TaxID=2045208 RepID=A0ABY4A622_9BURK|nr:hypothetical protein [Massilia violaceinigra]UOD28088.1 hypothetical protein INH39_21785 [Massilia violaceinigra]
MAILEPLVCDLGYVRRQVDPSGECIRWRPTPGSGLFWLDSPDQDVGLRIADENIIEKRKPADCRFQKRQT